MHGQAGTVRFRNRDVSRANRRMGEHRAHSGWLIRPSSAFTLGKPDRVRDQVRSFVYCAVGRVLSLLVFFVRPWSLLRSHRELVARHCTYLTACVGGRLSEGA